MAIGSRAEPMTRDAKNIKGFCSSKHFVPSQFPLSHGFVTRISWSRLNDLENPPISAHLATQLNLPGRENCKKGWMALIDLVWQSYFREKGKRANAIKARTTRSLEETKSKKIQNRDNPDAYGQAISDSSSSNSDNQDMRWVKPITCRQSIDWLKYY